ncbi:hypothetical protein HDU97_007850 [Phlyctochytrium planicorne]|nr:hypothetical protein HDU97_007850 [Phlyctochytrium planicorne]
MDDSTTTSTWAEAATATATARSSPPGSAITPTSFIIAGVVGGTLLLSMLGILIYASSPRAFAWLEKRDRENAAAEAAANGGLPGTPGSAASTNTNRLSRKPSSQHPRPSSVRKSGGLRTDMDERQMSVRGSVRSESGYVPSTASVAPASYRRTSTASALEDERESRIYQRPSTVSLQQHGRAPSSASLYQRGGPALAQGAGDRGYTTETNTDDYTEDSQTDGEGDEASQQRRRSGETDSDYIYVSDLGIMAPGNVYRVPSHSSIPGVPIGSKRWSDLPPAPEQDARLAKRRSMGDAFIQAGSYFKREVRKSNSTQNFPSPTSPAAELPYKRHSRPSSVSSRSSAASGNLHRVFSAPDVQMSPNLHRRGSPRFKNAQPSHLALGRRATGGKEKEFGVPMDPSSMSSSSIASNVVDANLLTFRSRSEEPRLPSRHSMPALNPSPFPAPSRWPAGHPFPGFHPPYGIMPPPGSAYYVAGVGQAPSVNAFTDGDHEASTLDRTNSTANISILGAYQQTSTTSRRGDMFADDGDAHHTTERPRFSLDAGEEDDEEEEDYDEVAAEDDEGVEDTAYANRDFQSIEPQPLPPTWAIAGVGRGAPPPPVLPPDHPYAMHGPPGSNRYSAPNLQAIWNPLVVPGPPGHPPIILQPHHASLARMTLGYPPPTSAPFLPPFTAVPPYPHQLPASNFFVPPFHVPPAHEIPAPNSVEEAPATSPVPSLHRRSPNGGRASPAFRGRQSPLIPPTSPTSMDEENILPTISESEAERTGSMQKSKKKDSGKKKGKAAVAAGLTVGFADGTNYEKSADGPISPSAYSESSLAKGGSLKSTGTSSNYASSPSTTSRPSNGRTSSTPEDGLKTRTSSTSTQTMAQASSGSNPRSSTMSSKKRSSVHTSGGGSLRTSSGGPPRVSDETTAMFDAIEEEARKSLNLSNSSYEVPAVPPSSAGSERASKRLTADASIVSMVESIQMEVRSSLSLSPAYVDAPSKERISFEAFDSLERNHVPGSVSVRPEIALPGQKLGDGQVATVAVENLEAGFESKKKRGSWWRR